MTWGDGTTTPRSAPQFEALLLNEAVPARFYNVESYPYSAVPDEFFTDGVATSGSATFTSATANFTAGDVGKTIVILRGGVSQAQDHHTTITAVGSATSVTLAHSAGRTMNPARFYISRGGDQTTAIQAAIDAAGAAGGGVVLLPGVGYLTSGVTLKNRVTLRGHGAPATMLHLIASANGPVVTNDQTSNNSAMWCGVEDMRVDGNRARQADTTTTLASGYTAGNTTLSLTSAASFQNAGSLLIGTNRLHYSSKSGNTLSGVVGGVEGTTDAGASGGATVTQHRSHGISFGVVPFNTTPTSAESGDPHFFVRRCFVKNCKGDGIQNWGSGETHYIDTYVEYADHFGIRPSFDAWLTECSVASSGRSGFFIRSSDVRATACKAWFNGGNVGAEGHGFFLEGQTGLEEGTKSLVACTSQDNKAYGFLLKDAQRCVIQGTSSSNSVTSVDSYTGVGVLGTSSLNIIDVACTERNAPSANAQQSALFIEAAATENQIRLTHGPTGSATVGPAVKSGSSLAGGNSVTINGMGGAVASSVSGSVTVNPYLATTHRLTLTGNITALNAPSNGHAGCELELVLIQDGSGSKTLSGANSVFKWTGAAAPTLTTTANRRDTFRFRSDGTNWYEIARTLNVG